MSEAEKKVEETAPEEEVKTPAPSESKDVAVSNINFDEDAGTGQEDMGADDIQIPRLNIVQALSPQRQETKPEYIEGAQEGQIFDNGSKTLWPGNEGVLVVPVKFQKSYLEWAKRETGKGLVKHHGNDGTAYNNTKPNEKYQRITNDGNEIVPTAEYFVYMIDEKTGQFKPYVLSMSKSGLKHAKRWNLLINQLTDEHPANPENKNWNAPIFWGVYKLKAVPESNQQGQWFRWEIQAAGNIKQFDSWESIYTSAKDFRKSIEDGGVKVREPAEADHHSGDAESDDDPM